MTSENCAVCTIAADDENSHWGIGSSGNWKSPQVINYKYNEKNLITELQAYVDGTYDEHYAQGNIQTTEFIIDMGDGIPFTRGNVIKYAQRYGKKGGRNRKDLLKILHYALIMLHVHDLETQHADK